MTCTNCALGIERYLEKQGAGGIRVDFSSGEVEFTTSDPQRLKNYVKGIEKLGYEVVEEGEESSAWSWVERYFTVSAFFTLPLILHMFLSWEPLHHPWVQFGLSLPVFLIGMWYFGRSALSSLRAGVPNMDVLISLGAIAAFAYSLYGAIFDLGPDFLFFETAATIITLVLLGNVIEHRSVQQTTASIKELQALQPKLALRLDTEGQWREVPISKIEIGDRLRVLEGQKVPVDGEVLSMEAEVDESLLTGESLPQTKSKGDKLMSGSLLIQGQVEMRASRKDKSSTLAQIIDLVKKAQGDKPNIQRLADRISAVFVPVVLAIATLTFLLGFLVFDLGATQAMIQAIAVLVIACPCAMGLATPTAVVVGIGRASRKGILIKGGRILEQFSEIKQVVFDKTGTLTSGNFSIRSIEAAHPAEIGEVKKIIKSLEEYSTHPIAKSIRKALADVDTQDLKAVKEVKGVGISGQDVEGNAYQIGSYRLAQGLVEDKYSLYVLKNGDFWAGIRIEDQLKEGSREVIEFLKANHIKPILLSGDKRANCEEVARQLGIEEVYAEQLPQEKLAKIEALSREKPTAMVGDGINDAPALAQATIGISLSEATEIAQQSAEVILLKGKLSLIPELFAISKHTLRTIKENLFWAFFYNVLMIPVAALGYLRPMLAALSMAFSDVFVIGNSIRLRFKKLN